jgi:hypothetical protein
MNLKKSAFLTLLFLSSFSFCSFAFADTYNAIVKYKCPYTNASYTVNGTGFTTSYIYDTKEQCLAVWNNNRTSAMISAGNTFFIKNTTFIYILHSDGTEGTSNLYTFAYQSTCPGDGTLTGTYPNQTCTGATSCSSGQVRDPATGICGVDTSCPTGTVIELGVLEADPPRSTDGLMTIDISGDPLSLQYTVKDGKQYKYADTDYTGSCYIKTDGTYCNYNVTSTGVCNVTANNNTGITPSTGTAVSTSNNGTCFTDSKNNTTCKTNPVSNRTCGSVNGSQICVDTTSGTGTVNGLAYQTSDKNCGFLNGQPVCVSDNSNSSTVQGCLRNGGVVSCVDQDIKTTTNVTHTTNQNGDTVTTTTVHDNIINDTDTVTTETCTTAGTCSTTTVSNPTTATGNTANSATTATNCPGCAQETTLNNLAGTVAKDASVQALKGSVDALGAGSGHSLTAVSPGSFDSTIPTSAADTAKTAYQDKFNEVKTALTGSITALSTGGGSLPTYDLGVIHGVQVTIDLNRWANELSPIGGSVILAAAFISVIIILG